MSLSSAPPPQVRPQLIQIKAAISMVDNKREILADTDEMNVAQKEDLHDPNIALEVDREYLQNVNEQFALHEKEHAQRVNTRQEEFEAAKREGQDPGPRRLDNPKLLELPSNVKGGGVSWPPPFTLTCII